jgi:hypothetical protein
MSAETERQRYAQRIADSWADKGKIIEGGWRAYEHLVLPPDASDTQRAETRKAWFLGAEHIFSTIMMVMDPGEEPSDRDLARMSKLHAELEAFKLELTSHHKAAERQQ